MDRAAARSCVVPGPGYRALHLGYMATLQFSQGEEPTVFWRGDNWHNAALLSYLAKFLLIVWVFLVPAFHSFVGDAPVDDISLTVRYMHLRIGLPKKFEV